MKHFLLILIVLCPLLMEQAYGQRHFNEELSYCQRTGKAILLYDANFITVGYPSSHSIIGMDDGETPGFNSSGVMLRYGTMRYFDLDINRSRLGIGYNVPLTGGVIYWENSDLNHREGLTYRPYIFFGIGGGPLLTVRVVDDLLFDIYTNVNPVISYYGGYKHEDYSEYSFISFKVGAQIGTNFRYRWFMAGCDWMPGKTTYKVYSYIDGDSTPESPENRKIDIGMVNFSIGAYF